MLGTQPLDDDLERAERAERAPAAPGGRASPALLVGLATFVVLTLVVVARNRWILVDGRVEDGDFAANSILIDRARTFRLLIGNYSRVGFNHPGPALLYVQAIPQVLLHDLLPLVPRPFNAHVLGAVMFNAALMASTAVVVVRRTGSVLAAAAVGPLALLLGVIERGSASSTWFPDLYMWPFLLTCVAVASVLAGGCEDLPIALFGFGVLVHGHVSFALFVGGLAALAFVVLWRTRALHRVERRTWIASGAVVALFAIPVLVNLAVAWPGELDDYWRYSRSSQAGGHPFGDVVDYVARYWSFGSLGAWPTVGAFVAGIALTIRRRDDRARRFMVALVVVVVATTVLTVVYVVRGVDDIGFRYVAQFYRAAPLLGFLLVAIGVADLTDGPRARRAARALLGGVCVVGAVWLASSPEQRAVFPGANWLLAADAALDASTSRDAVRVFRFGNDTWPAVAGLIEESRRDGEDVCVEEPRWRPLFTSELICDATELRDGTVVVVRSASPDAVDLPTVRWFEGNGIVIGPG